MLNAARTLLLTVTLAVLLITGCDDDDGDGNDAAAPSPAATAAATTAAGETTEATPTQVAATPTAVAATPTAVAATPTAVAATPTAVAATPTAVAEPQDRTQYPVTVDVCGVDVTFDAAPTRVIVQEANALDILLALGLGDRVIGYFGDAPVLPQNEAAFEANDIERFGGSWPIPSLEALLDANPDFVWSYGYDESVGNTVESQLDAGLGPYAFTEACTGDTRAQDFEQVYAYIREVSEIFDVQDRGAELIAELEGVLAAAADRVPEGVEPPSVFLMDFGEGPIFTAARGAAPTAMIEAAGGRNIYGDTQGDAANVWIYATLEDIVAKDPEAVIIVDYGDRDARIQLLEDSPVLSGMQAVVDQRYGSIIYGDVIPGLRMFYAVETV
ncbi:MAG: ABC transporter substrate-binding protein, partial [Chloroflexi bacterium]|nr:ABC transporter substrate-binding protein [Chloroflexota bacterium]